MKNFTLFILLTIILFCSCNTNKVTDKLDYQAYLEINANNDLLESDLNFWATKLENTPNQFPYYVKRAGVYSQLFSNTADIETLILAEKDLQKANEKTAFNNAGYLRALAHNYVSQHKFKEALELLEKAELNGEKLKSTQKMLFDVHLELGNDTKAEAYLNKLKNFSDFDYLIRLSKWKDHNGNLDEAIKYMERATTIAESSNNKSLKQWAFTNLADFYGHAGKIEMSYKHYLKALELNPNDAYAKKGIAWIVYSHERNTDEALRILNHISQYYDAPDYELLKAEIADFKGDTENYEKAMSGYNSKSSNTLYGDMYNQYDILLLTEDAKEVAKAIEISKKEVNNRPTAQTYNLLAWSYFKAGNLEKALNIIDTYVIGKTEEPAVLYHIAEIYKAANRTDEVSKLKKELIGSIYELGPTMEQKIFSL